MLLLLVSFFAAFFFFLVRICSDALSKLVLSIFGGFWAFSLIGTQFGIQGLNIPEDSTLLICILGILSFYAGYILVKITPNTILRYNSTTLKRSIDGLISNKIFSVFLYITTIYIISQDILFFNVIFVDKVLMGNEVRGSLWDDESFYSPTFRFAVVNIFSWFIPIVRALFCYSLFFKRERITVVMFFLLFGFAALDAGRIGYVRAIIPLIVVIGLFQVSRGKIYLLKTQKTLLLSILFISLVFIFVISTIRNSSNDFKSAMSDGWDATTEQIVSYSIGPVVAFDHQINSNVINRSIGGYGYGSVSLWPFMTPYFRLQTPYKGINPNFVDFREYTEKNKIDIGLPFNWNGLYTWNLNFYVDGGILGVILLNFLFGFLMRSVIKLTYLHQTVYTFILCSLVLIFVFQSPMKLLDYYVIDPVFIIVLLLLSKVKKDRHSYKSVLTLNK